MDCLRGFARQHLRVQGPRRQFAWLALLMVAFCVSVHAGPVRHPLVPSASRVVDYTDDSGITHLTNVPDESASHNFQVIVPGDATPLRDQASGPRAASSEVKALIDEASRTHHLEPALLYAVMATESAFRQDAVSSKGAAGLMQLMPDTAARMGVADRFDARSSVFGGAKYLRSLLDQFGGDAELAVAAYNAGSESVERYHRSVPPFPETQAYVPRVLGLYQRSRALFSAQ